MPVIQGGSIVYDNAQTQQNAAKNLTGALQNYAVLQQNQQKNAQDFLPNALALFDFAQQASGLPLQPFLGTNEGVDAMNILGKTVQQATGRRISSDELSEIISRYHEYNADPRNWSLEQQTKFFLGNGSWPEGPAPAGENPPNPPVQEEKKYYGRERDETYHKPEPPPPPGDKYYGRDRDYNVYPEPNPPVQEKPYFGRERDYEFAPYTAPEPVVQPNPVTVPQPDTVPQPVTVPHPGTVPVPQGDTGPVTVPVPGGDVQPGTIPVPQPDRDKDKNRQPNPGAVPGLQPGYAAQGQAQPMPVPLYFDSRDNQSGNPPQGQSQTAQVYNAIKQFVLSGDLQSARALAAQAQARAGQGAATPAQLAQAEAQAQAQALAQAQVRAQAEAQAQAEAAQAAQYARNGASYEQYLRDMAAAQTAQRPVGSSVAAPYGIIPKNFQTERAPVQQQQPAQQQQAAPQAQAQGQAAPTDQIKAQLATQTAQLAGGIVSYAKAHGIQIPANVIPDPQAVIQWASSQASANSAGKSLTYQYLESLDPQGAPTYWSNALKTWTNMAVGARQIGVAISDATAMALSAFQNILRPAQTERAPTSQSDSYAPFTGLSGNSAKLGVPLAPSLAPGFVVPGAGVAPGMVPVPLFGMNYNPKEGLPVQQGGLVRSGENVGGAQSSNGNETRVLGALLQQNAPQSELIKPQQRVLGSKMMVQVGSNDVANLGSLYRSDPVIQVAVQNQYPDLGDRIRKGDDTAFAELQKRMDANGLKLVPGMGFMTMNERGYPKKPATEEELKNASPTSAEITKPITVTKITPSGKAEKKAVSDDEIAKAPVPGMIWGPSTKNIDNYTGPKAKESAEKLMSDPVAVSNVMEKLKSAIGMPTKTFQDKADAHNAAVTAGSWMNTVWKNMPLEERKQYVQYFEDKVSKMTPSVGYFAYGDSWAARKLAELDAQAQIAQAAAQSASASASVQIAAMKELFNGMSSATDSIIGFAKQVVDSAAQKGYNLTEALNKDPQLKAILKSATDMMNIFTSEAGYGSIVDAVYRVFTKTKVKGFLGLGREWEDTTEQANSQQKLSASDQALVDSLLK